ncbi:hypothetical protein [Moorena producens]
MTMTYALTGNSLMAIALEQMANTVLRIYEWLIEQVRRESV